MKWTSAVSEEQLLDNAVAECLEALDSDLAPQDADLVLAFPSVHHADGLERFPAALRDHYPNAVILGCSGNGIIGAGREVEGRAGLSITAARMPGVRITPFRFDDRDLPDADAGPQEWEGVVGVSAESSPQFVILADPFSVRGEDMLMGLDFAFPSSTKIGGLASGGQQSGTNALFLDGACYRTGVVGAALRGSVLLDTIVAQGCRPIGSPMVVTACDRNILLEVDGRSPMDALREVFAGLDERDRGLVQHSLFLGVVMDELIDSPQLGDFLVRNVIGADQNSGVLAIGELLAEGQTVQFHLRDADTSSQDLDALLTRYSGDRHVHEGSGALLFQCLGRGSYLYGRPDHDTEMFREKVGSLPLTGFFCNGEIGPVGNTTFIHGYTSSFGIFRPKPGAF